MRASLLVSVVLTSLACTPVADVEGPDAGAAPASTGPIEQAGPAPRGELELRPIALREGNMVVAEVDGRPYVVIDGEPIPLSANAAPSRDAKLGLGLAPITSMWGPMFEFEQIGGSLGDGSAVLMVREDFERVGSEHHVYELAGGEPGWRLRPVPEHGRLTEYFVALVPSPEGGLLGLRSYEVKIDSDAYEFTDDSPESEAHWAAVAAELAAAQTGFTLLSGTAAVIPTVPPGWTIAAAAATDGGHIVAVAQPGSDGSNGSSEGAWQLLEWAPGASSPTIHALPGVTGDRIEPLIEVWAAGDEVLVAAYDVGTEASPGGPYLARGLGSSWARVALPSQADPGERWWVKSATITDDGELWLTVDSWSNSPEGSQLWRQSGGAWVGVSLPAVDEAVRAADASPRWAHDPLQEAWLLAAAADPNQPAPPIQARAREVLWSDGELWVVADLGGAYPTAEEFYVAERRTVLYTSGPGLEGEPVWLTSYDQLQLERIDHQVVVGPKLAAGDDGCRSFTIVVHPAADSSEAATIATRLAGELPSLDGAGARELFVGARLDPSSPAELVYTAYANSSNQARRLLELVGKRAKTKVTSDCRPRKFVRPVAPG